MVEKIYIMFFMEDLHGYYVSLLYNIYNTPKSLQIIITITRIHPPPHAISFPDAPVASYMKASISAYTYNFHSRALVRLGMMFGDLLQHPHGYL